MNAADSTLYSVNMVKNENERGTPLFRDGAVRNYAANVSGGTGLFRFFAAGEWNAQQGIDYANERTQQNARTNLSVTPNEQFDLETNVGYMKSKTSTSCEGTCGGSLWGSEYSNPNKLAQFCPAPRRAAAAGDAGSTASRQRRIARTQYWSGHQPLHRQRHGEVEAGHVDDPSHVGGQRLHAALECELHAVHHERHDRLLLWLRIRWLTIRSLNSAFYNTYDYSGSVNLNV